jgi:hypothetical protein
MLQISTGTVEYGDARYEIARPNDR